MDSIKFTVEEDLALVECINMHFCLYNTDASVLSTDFEFEESFWKEISDHLQKSVDNCKARWEMMKKSRNEKKTNNELSTESETTNDTAKLLLEDILSFVASTSGTQGTSDISSNQNNAEQESASAATVQIPTESEPQTSTFAFQPTEQSAENKKRKAPTESREAKRTKQNKEVISTSQTRNERKIKNMSKAKKYDNIDPIDAFFKSVAITIRQFPLELRMKSKIEFVRLLSRLEVRNFRLNK